MGVRPSRLDPAEPWRGVLTAGDEHDEVALDTVLMCPEYAAREFGGD